MTLNSTRLSLRRRSDCPRHSRPPSPSFPRKRESRRLATRNQVQTVASGSLLPLWEKARMRVSPRASAALRAGRPRSQTQTYLYKPIIGRGDPLAAIRAWFWVASLANPLDSRFRGNDGGSEREWRGEVGNGGASQGRAAISRSRADADVVLAPLDSRFRGNGGKKPRPHSPLSLRLRALAPLRQIFRAPLD